MASNLGQQSRINVRQTVSVPSYPQIIENLPVLHQILESIVQDWHNSVNDYERHMAQETDFAEYIAASAIKELQPAFLKCLFSYVFFFVSAENAYDYLYSDLRKADTFKCRHRSQPERTATIKKARRIRNISIAHFPNQENRVSEADTFASICWDMLTLSRSNEEQTYDLSQLTFGGFRINSVDRAGKVTQSQDIEVRGLDDLHRECFSYLEQYDEICCEYLNNLRAAVVSANAGNTG